MKPVQTPGFCQKPTPSVENQSVRTDYKSCSLKTFLNRSADLMLTISLGNVFQSLTVLQK